MNELVEWLRSVLADDEKAAKAATPGPWSARFQDTGAVVDPGVAFDREEGGVGWEDAVHIARHDPTAVLADIEAKRAVLDLYEETRDTDPESLQPPRKDLHAASTLVGGMQDGLELAVRALARAYRHRLGWKSEWE